MLTTIHIISQEEIINVAANFWKKKIITNDVMNIAKRKQNIKRTHYNKLSTVNPLNFLTNYQL
jgi:hypothetical protein